MICREGAWAFNRFVHLRCLRFTAPKGRTQNNSGSQRMGNYFYFVVAGAVSDPEEGVGHRSMPLPWGTSQSISPGAPASTLFGLERAIPKWPIFASDGPFLVLRDCFGPRGQFDSKSPAYTEKCEVYIFRWTFSVPGVPLELQGSFVASLEEVLDPPMRS